MTSLLLVRDPAFCRAVLGSLGISEATDPSAPSIPIAILGNEELTCLPAGDPGALDLAQKVYRGLGLGGWAVVVVARDGEAYGWREVQVQPDLSPGGFFVRALSSQEISLGSAVSRVLDWGLARHRTEVGLKNHFKDKI